MSRRWPAILFAATMVSGCKQSTSTGAPIATPTSPAIRGTYAKDCAAAPPGWHRSSGEVRENLTHYTVTLYQNGRLTWSGEPVETTEFRDHMREVDSQVGNDVRLIVAPEADCGQVQAVRAMMNEFAICNTKSDCLEGTAGMPPPPD